MPIAGRVGCVCMGAASLRFAIGRLGGDRDRGSQICSRRQKFRLTPAPTREDVSPSRVGRHTSVVADGGIANLGGKHRGRIDRRHAFLSSRQLRLAVTMNGGVSLAVYMGGVAQELNEFSVEDGPHWNLLDYLGHPSAPAIDVLTGTSAGGINAAALALAQSNANPTDLSELKRLWVKHGQIGSLLRQPFQSGMYRSFKATITFCRKFDPPLTGSQRITSDPTVRLTHRPSCIQKSPDRGGDAYATHCARTDVA